MNSYDIPFWKALTIITKEAICMHSCHKMPLCQVLDLSLFNIKLTSLSFLKKPQYPRMSN